MNNVLDIYCDGGARGNPGPGAIGVVFKDERGKTIKTLSKAIGQVTNNEAEYRAVIEMLTALKEQQFFTARVYLDSRLVVEQLNGRFRVRESRLQELILKVRALEVEIGKLISYHAITREQNQAADHLVNLALDQANPHFG